MNDDGKTICWRCANACGKCSWSGLDEKGKSLFKPVDGWDAEKITVRMWDGKNYVPRTSYIVKHCPLFVDDSEKEDENVADHKALNEKLTAEQARAIRQEFIPRSKTNGREALSKKYGISRKTITDIVQRRTWRDV